MPLFDSGAELRSEFDGVTDTERIGAGRCGAGTALFLLGRACVVYLRDSRYGNRG